jgi:hypothetical protein
MKIAIMQPYLFPYIGYFQMINAVDHFVFYDDVNFINRGWINRNRILVNGKDTFITVPLIKASQNKKINEINLFFDEKMKKKMILTIELAYKKAPYYNQVIEIIKKIVNADISNIGEYAANSIITLCNYLKIETSFSYSSIQSPESRGMNKADRLIFICKKLGADEYINAIGGQEFYTKEYFENNQINLQFIKTQDCKYEQYNDPFVPWLSIIDVMMFNNKVEIKKILHSYKLY